VARRDEIQAVTALFKEAIQLQAGAAPEPYLKLDITLVQLKTVMVLFAKGPQSISALARAIEVSAAVATGIVDRLQGQALIQRERHPADRRVTLVSLTPAGTDLVEEITTAGVERLAALLAALGDDDLRALHRGYAALVEALRDSETRP